MRKSENTYRTLQQFLTGLAVAILSTTILAPAATGGLQTTVAVSGVIVALAVMTVALLMAKR